MESLTIQENIKNHTNNTGNVEDESSEQFQNFIYELFDRNGVLNDLRAYLRGRIVHVLNSAQSGEPPLYQKRFMQRLDVTLQAVNAIITEYLLKQEFQYSLSVFLSEIPLTNMVFEFTKSLLNHKTPTENSCLKFTEKDIYSIFNFLGIRCDSTDIEQIVKMYENPEGPPLLLCIFKCIHLHETPSNTNFKGYVTTEEHKKTTEIQIPKILHGKCRHRSTCKNCQTRYQKLRQKYVRKNKEFKLAFMQMKASYDSEIESAREEERAKADDLLKAQAEHLEERVIQLQQRYTEREAALERDAEQTRRFVRGLARRLRTRLATVLDAATALRDERRRLNIKEENLKRELTLAEEILSSQGEELKTEISNELAALEGHLDAMKRERDTINKERAELQTMKQKNDDQKKDQILKMNYELMKEELALLKEHLKTIKSPLEMKQTVNKEVLTEECEISHFNSFQNSEQNYNNTTQYASDPKNSEKIVYNKDIASDPPKKVVNDFRKEKNVNITTDAQVQASVEDPRTLLWPMASRELLVKLSERWYSEGLQLNLLAAQQGTHLEYLAAQQAKLRAELESRRYVTRVPLPTHCLPKRTTVVRDSNEDGTETGSPAPLPATRVVSTTVERCSPRERSATVYKQLSRRALRSLIDCERPCNNNVLSEEQNQTDVMTTSEHRKGKIKSRPTEDMKSSQDSVLQEAIFKLKKLEIEAEAVEDAYLDLKKRHAERVTSLQLENCRRATKKSQESLTNMFDASRIHPTKNTIKPASYFQDTKDLFHLHHKVDYDNREHFASHKRSLGINKKTKTKIHNPEEKLVETLPNIRNKVDEIYDENLLDTPLVEFRKYYYASEHFQFKPTPEMSKLQNISKTYPVVKDTASSPIVFLNIARESNIASTSANESSINVEKAQSDIKKLEDTLKTMYVNNIITDSSEKLDEVNAPDNLNVIKKERSKEQEIRQVDLTSLQDDNSSINTESEPHRSQSRTHRSSIGSSIKNTEKKSEELLVNLLPNDQCVVPVNELIDDCKKPTLDIEIAPATSPKLQFNTKNAPIDSNENDKKWDPKENAETDHIKSNSPDDLTDISRSESPFSLEKYSSVDDNFWQ